MSAKTKLPERWRLARNIDVGYEIRFQCPIHGDEWLRVVSTLHMVSPLAISSLRVEPLGETNCLDGDRLGVYPDNRLFSRRPAVSDDAR